MRHLLCIILLFSGFSGISQYTYFNNIYQENSLSTNVLSVGDKIFYAGSGGGNVNFVTGKLDLDGSVVELFNSELENDWFYPQSGSSMNVKLEQQGFIYGISGSIDGQVVGSIYSLDLEFNILWSFHKFSENPDTISYEYFLAKELSDGIYGLGHSIYDYNEGPGTSYSNLLITKLDPDGNLIWENEYNWSEIVGEESFLRVSQVQEMPNGEILICANRYHDWDNVLIKMNTDGEILDQYIWGDELNEWLAFAVPLENNEVMIGYRLSFDYYNGDPLNTISNLHLMKFDFETMEPIWDIEYDYPHKHIYPHDLLQTSDGGFMLGGWTVVDEDVHPTATQMGVILKTDSVGTFEWLKYYNHEDPTPEEDPDNENHELYDMDNTSDGGVVACGRFMDMGEGFQTNAWVFKIDVCGDVEDLGCPQYTNVIDYQDIVNPQILLYPNPTHSLLNLEFPFASINNTYQYKIFDMKGQLISSNQVESVLSISVDQWSAGIYLLQLVNNQGHPVDSKKFVVK